jgi:soluble lytic murein transglycosylase-like protein
MTWRPLALVVALAMHGAALAQPEGGAKPGVADFGVAGGMVDPSHIEAAAVRFALPSELVRAVIAAESDGRPDAVSSAGAMGLMQLMPGTWAMLRARLSLGPDPFDPADNILAGAAYLRELLDRYGDPGFLAAYNAGPGRYEQSLVGRPLPAETRTYVARITTQLQRRGLWGRDGANASLRAGGGTRMTGLFPAPWPSALGQTSADEDGAGSLFASRREASR